MRASPARSAGSPARRPRRRRGRSQISRTVAGSSGDRPACSSWRARLSGRRSTTTKSFPVPSALTNGSGMPPPGSLRSAGAARLGSFGRLSALAGASEAGWPSAGAAACARVSAACRPWRRPWRSPPLPSGLVLAAGFSSLAGAAGAVGAPVRSLGAAAPPPRRVFLDAVARLLEIHLQLIGSRVVGLLFRRLALGQLLQARESCGWRSAPAPAR